MKHIKYFLVGFLFLIPFLNADAATYYVDSSCALSGNGSSQTCATANGGVGAFNSLAKVKAKVGGYTAGDAVLFKRDQTFPLGTLTSGFIINWSGTLGNPITFGDYGTGAKPIINATGATRGFDLQNVSNITVTNIAFQNATSPTNTVTGGNILIRSNGSIQNLLFDGIEVRNATRVPGISFFYTNVTAGFSNITIQNATIAGNTNMGVYLSPGTSNTTSNISILNTTVSNNTNEGLAFIGLGNINGLTIMDSIFLNNTSDGILLTNAQSLNIQNITTNLNGGKGISINPNQSVSPITLTNITANQNSSHGISIGNFISGGTVSNSNFNLNNNGFEINGSSSNITISNTTASSNFNDGFSVKGSASNIIFEHCVADGNAPGGLGTAGDGFSFHGTTSGTIRYSIAKNNTKSAVANVENSSVNMYYNLFSHTTSGTGNGLVYLNVNNGATSNHTFYNNVLYTGSSGAGTGLYLGGATAGSLIVTVKNNIISNFGIGLDRVNTLTLTETNNLLYNNVISWQGTTPGLGSFIANPLFVNAPGGDFSIEFGSPAINTGTPVGFTTDYAGNTIVGNPDIGAYEKQPSYTTLNLNLKLEGFYDTTTHTMRPVRSNQGNGVSKTDVDIITVELRDATTPTIIVASTTAMLQTNGNAVCNFATSPSGSYYIVVKHRNSIQTWSATAVTVGATAATYNFSNASNKAFGNNMYQIESGVWSFFSGDINQDGNIDNADYSNWESDLNNSAFGDYTSDLDGDGFVDVSDYVIWERNANNFSSVITP